MNQIYVKTNFTSGQLSKNLYGRGDLRIFENGAGNLQNVLISPTGGVSRRKGLRMVDEIGSEGRIISFEFNTEQTYLLCFQDKSVKISLVESGCSSSVCSSRIFITYRMRSLPSDFPCILLSSSANWFFASDFFESFLL